jgi:dipeptidyl aminopeptidase/acylaminoacyl peptidase
MKPATLIVLLGFLTSGAAAQDAIPAAPDDAALFGELEHAYSVALSTDGKRVAYVSPGPDGSATTVVLDLATGVARPAARSDGKPLSMAGCDWSSADRLVCTLFGVQRVDALLFPKLRTFAMDSDGTNQLALGERDTLEQLGRRQYDGEIVDWMSGTDGVVLMARTYVPEKSVGTLIARNRQGLGVDRIDTRTGKVASIERPGRDVVNYISDGLGNIRIMTTAAVTGSGYMRGIDTHFYRLVDDRTWRKLGTYAADRANGGRGSGMVPLAIDSSVNAAYVLQLLDGRYALYRIALDGSLKSELVFASREVDVDDVIRVGRAGRVIGARYVTERRMVEFFDPDYREIYATLERALPQSPLIDFISASANEQLVVVRASSDVDPGSWYVFDRTKKSLDMITKSRPTLEGKTLSPVKAITFPAADGTRIPGYLTLPPGITEAKGLPAIVMPHGGPGSRYEWGFDWLAQYFAQRGFVVLQPNFRGSAGYGDAWFLDNGFRSWKISVGDVCDGGRWLIAQSMANPQKLAAFGWSYGGYAALQANVLDANLFKAVIAVAPVTDLGLLKNQASEHANTFLVADMIGNGPHVREGSPADNAGIFKAPVLMFHGTSDFNVEIEQSRRMDRALRRAGKSSQFVVYPELRHDLFDAAARADMLRKSEAFLRANLAL